MNPQTSPNAFTYNAAALAFLDEFFFTPNELAARWRTHASTLANKRAQGVGLRYTKIDGKVLYRSSDVIRAELDSCADVGLPRVLELIGSFEGLDRRERDALAKHIKAGLREVA